METIKPRLSGSAGLTIVATVAVATGPALLGAPRSFVLNVVFINTVYGKRSFLSKESDTLRSYRVYISPCECGY